MRPAYQAGLRRYAGKAGALDATTLPLLSSFDFVVNLKAQTGTTGCTPNAAAGVQQALTIRAPDDWHLHVRDGAGMQSAVPETARRYRRAVIMPNLVPPVTAVPQV